MRICGCGKRGRHKPTCAEANKTTTVVKKAPTLPRSCGCGARGKHKLECILSNKSVSIYEGPTDIHSLVIYGYGIPPHLYWYPHKDRQKTIENRLIRLVRRYKAFYLNTTSLDNNQEETWYIDGGNWVSVNNEFIGHIKNCLEFLDGNSPMWYNERRRLV